MENETVLELLVNSGIIVETSDGSVELTESFLETLNQQEEKVREKNTAKVKKELRSGAASRNQVSRLEELAESDTEFIAHYLAVDQVLDEHDFERIVKATVLLERFEAQASPTEGSPALFFPIRGEKLPTLLTIFPVAVVYIWREDSSECRTMKRDLETLFDESPESIALFSVYGPESAAFLDEEYDVIGGPTTLFVVDGDVDSRLHGAHFPTVVDREIKELLETAKMRNVL